MALLFDHAVRLLRKTPFKTFFLYPVIALVWELFLSRGAIRTDPLFLPVMLWGYLQYRLCGIYRTQRGGGGPGLDMPPQRLVATGPYAYTRNPMYLGHIIFLIGLSLTLRSPLAALITVASALWLHYRVLGDEKNLVERFGEPYVQYAAAVKRWLPKLF